jgi:hypothetical protein
MISGIFSVLMILAAVIAETTLNRHTTISVSARAFWAAYALTMSMVLPFLVLSLRNEDGEVRWIVTRNLSVLQRRQRLFRAALILIGSAIVVAWWSWHMVGIAAQYSQGLKASFSGTVTEVFDHVTGRQSCAKSFDIQTYGGTSYDICYSTDLMPSQKPLSSSPPRRGQNIVVITRRSWFGTVADAIE